MEVNDLFGCSTKSLGSMPSAGIIDIGEYIYILHICAHLNFQEETDFHQAIAASCFRLACMRWASSSELSPRSELEQKTVALFG